MFPRLPRVRFFALLYGVLAIGFSSFAIAYAVQGQTISAAAFGVLAIGEFVLAGWYASEPDGVDEPERPSPSTFYEYLLTIFVLAVTVGAFWMLFGTVL